MDTDKKKICDWIMNMNIDDFYEFCICLSEGYEFTEEQLYYSCRECKKEHSEECEECEGCDDCLEKCKEFFVKHYTEKKIK